MSGGSGEKSPLQSAPTRTNVMFKNLEYSYCTTCHGTMVPLGLEPRPEEYVQHLVSIFDEVARVLKSTGTAWINLGDSYQDKQLLGVPWLFAFEMKRRGWILRRDIIWSKPNPMPESTRDRCTTSHEYIFMFSKNQSYFYDGDSIREEHTSAPIKGWVPVRGVYGEGVKGTKGPAGWHELGRNKRSVWTIPVQAYEGAHFATYPRQLAATCITAGTPPQGVVLDPFMGSGTTADVARSLGRRAVGIELNEEYCALIVNRTKQLSLLADVPEESAAQEQPPETTTSHGECEVVYAPRLVQGEKRSDTQSSTELPADVSGVLFHDGLPL